MAATHIRHATFAPYRELHEPSLLTTMFYGATSLAYPAVLLFFLLSGYLICGQGSPVLSTFLKRRLARIFPPLIPALLLTWAVEPPVTLWEAPAANRSLWCIPYFLCLYAFAGSVMARRPTLAAITAIPLLFMEWGYVLAWFAGAALSRCAPVLPQWRLPAIGSTIALPSYALFLTHYPIMYLLAPLLVPSVGPLAAFALILVASIIVAVAAYMAFERPIVAEHPFQIWKRKPL